MDLIPEGFLPLREAYDRFRNWLWNGLDLSSELLRTGIFVATSPAKAEQHRQQLETVRHREQLDLVEQFKSEALKAVVEDSSSPSGFRIVLRRHWAAAFFPERLLLADQVTAGHSRYFDKLIGRTLLVRASELATFCDSNRADRLQLTSVNRLQLTSVKLLKGLISPVHGSVHANIGALRSFEQSVFGPSEDQPGEVKPWEPKIEAAQRAMRSLYGTRFPLNKKNAVLLYEVNEFLGAHEDEPIISAATFRRAAEEAGFTRKRSKL